MSHAQRQATVAWLHRIDLPLHKQSVLCDLGPQVGRKKIKFNLCMYVCGRFKDLEFHSHEGQLKIIRLVTASRVYVHVCVCVFIFLRCCARCLEGVQEAVDAGH